MIRECLLILVLICLNGLKIMECGGICNGDFTLCVNNKDPRCLSKCQSVNYDPGYSCKLTGVLPTCTLQCICSYFNPNQTPSTTSTVATTLSTTTFKKPQGPYNECLLFGPFCKDLCKNPSNYCQVLTVAGPKSCVCHHWVRGNTLYGQLNDFLSINESLTSNNGIYRLTMINHYQLVEYELDNRVRFIFQGVSTFFADRFALTPAGVFQRQFVTTFNGDALSVSVGQFSSVKGSWYLVLEDNGYITFYAKNMTVIQSF